MNAQPKFSREVDQCGSLRDQLAAARKPSLDAAESPAQTALGPDDVKVVVGDEMTVVALSHAAMRECSQCGVMFALRPWQVRGSHRICLPCRNRKAADYRRRRKAEGRPMVSAPLTPEQRREWTKSYFLNPENRARHAALSRARRAQPAERLKVEVRRLTRSAIKAGKLVRQPCAVCGSATAEAHHDDYAKPLDVRWLCKPHHAEAHRTLRRSAI